MEHKEGAVTREKRAESELRRIKIECENLLRRQELEYEAEKERLIAKLEEKEGQIRELERPKSSTSTPYDYLNYRNLMPMI